MKLQQIKDYATLTKYVNQNPNLQIKKVAPPYPLENGGKVELLIHYETPIAYIVDKEVFTPLYTKQCFISMTTAKISSHLCKVFRKVSIESFIHYVYEYLDYRIIGKNRTFYDDYVQSLIGEK